MRVRKKPDLRLDIPSYPHDYVEMPPETRKKIEEVIRSSISPSIGDNTNTPSISNIVDSDDIREGTRTPEVRFVGPDVVKVKHKKEETKDDIPSAESPVVYRKANQGAANDLRTKKAVLNVSYFGNENT